MSTDRSTPSKPAAADSVPDRLPDARDAHTVGGNHDNLLESIGKAIVAPIEGADEGAHKPGSVPPRDAPPAR